MRILSRMVAFAFDKSEPCTTVETFECAQCFKEPHAILQPFEGTEEEMYDAQHKHTKETGHTEFRVYSIQVRRSRTALMPVDE